MLAANYSPPRNKLGLKLPISKILPEVASSSDIIYSIHTDRRERKGFPRTLLERWQAQTCQTYIFSKDPSLTTNTTNYHQVLSPETTRSKSRARYPDNTNSQVSWCRHSPSCRNFIHINQSRLYFSSFIITGGQIVQRDLFFPLSQMDHH